MKRISKRYKTSEKLSPSYYHKQKISRWEFEEYGPGKNEIIFCPKGDAVYYHKSWHHAFENYKHAKETKEARFALCPFHQMENSCVWEGEVRINGLKKEKIAEVLSLAKNFSHRAYLKDPMHRIIKIRQDKNSLSIFTSENQLSERLAKKIHETFKNLFSKPILHRAKGGDPFLVIIETKKI
ncbi:MAG: hypothetical protein A3H02_01120 [Candidatus Niyogibacteria bacterium RIFCSPLOWO2_12_FULL_41_13]|uniref:Uncharacterized protein n=1 Tax=Candidatus Niyogibacteria bacterium RIFCSPLOWO2_12_FULL_41_13 TaxID=1801726 RepID=A0A1G2F4U4_9BACT|nr:MAG: hypothetical protein A3H02_01120 [Candidatus Niyogibacteria bacterium RIFCSPLOWO2_12_FULL_41_13]